MFSVLLISLAAATRPDRAYPEAEPDRAAIDQAIKHQLVGSGYFRMVTDKAEQRSAIAGIQKRLRSLGIPITVRNCDWVGVVAHGFANSNLSYGAACHVRLGTKPTTDFLICDASLGGISLIKPDAYGWAPDYVEIFIRRTCV